MCSGDIALGYRFCEVVNEYNEPRNLGLLKERYYRKSGYVLSFTFSCMVGVTLSCKLRRANFVAAKDPMEPAMYITMQQLMEKLSMQPLFQ
jgi:hypothetical protein